MKQIILIALATSAFATFGFDRYKDDKIIFKDEPLEKNFVDAEWQCDQHQLKKASEQFMKCSETPVFLDCYAKMVKKYCTKKLF